MYIKDSKMPSSYRKSTVNVSLLCAGFSLLCLYTIISQQREQQKLLPMGEEEELFEFAKKERVEEKKENEAYDFDSIVRQYLEARESGLSQEEVAETVFNVSLLDL